METEQPLRLTLVWEPPRLPLTPMSSGPESLSPFLEELARHLGAPVPVEVCFLKDLRSDADFVLLSASIAPSLALAECAPQDQTELATKLVPLQVSGTRIFEMLETLTLPAAVPSLAMAEWQGSRHEEDGASGLYGLKEIGRAAGASCVDLFTSQHYCYLESSSHRGLPHLLSDYLRALLRMRSLAH